MSNWTDEDLTRLEAAHPDGLTVTQIVDAFGRQGEKLTEATFRKYVQLGLLPRSVRVGRKGKHKGSQGLYPPTTVRQLDELRRLMARGFTIDEIQREFLFVRGDIDALGRQLDRVYDAIDRASDERGGDPLVAQGLAEARRLGAELLGRLEGLERRISLRARMAKAAV